MRCNLLLQILAVGLLVAVLYVTPALSQWSTNPNINNAICTAANEQDAATIVSDGSGGAIITWEDRRGSSWDIYAQRVNASGVPQWTTNGDSICTVTGDQMTPAIISDGSGGAFITWVDTRSGNWDIYAQRVNASGAPQWTANGVAICAEAHSQDCPAIASDGSGGAIIAWRDMRGTKREIYAQRVNASGITQWTSNGVPMDTVTSYQWNPTIASDGSGGAIITWADDRNGNDDIYAQRVNASGTVQWTANGYAICTAAAFQENPVLVPDGSGGAIITWYDHRNGNDDIYAQRVNASGAVQWYSDGIAICTATGDQMTPVIISDGSGGAIITWTDHRGSNDDIYAQRVNASGVPQWITNGDSICTATGDQASPILVSDGSGGAIITWQDTRSNNSDIYAQHVNGSGTPQWTANGVAICSAPNGQGEATLASDGSGGAIITWEDYRNGNDDDIYAQKVDRFGYLGVAAPALTTVSDVRGDQGGKVSVGWNQSYLDTYPNQTVTSYSIWRGIDLASLSQSAKRIMPGEMTLDFSGEAYRVVETATGPTYWEWVGNLASHYLQNYAFTAPTLADSGPTGTHRVKFFISAQTSSQFVFWDSNVDSGYSVDNLPPSAVIALAAQPEAGPSVNVHWSKDITDPDVGYYEIHRSTTDGFTPGPSTKIGQTSDTTLVDVSPSSGTINYYRVVTVDIHGNKSAPSGQASAGVPLTTQYSVSDRWNLISVPLTVASYSKSALYPTATSNAFAYQGGYVTRATLANGVGYWLKFSGGQSVRITGLVRTRDSISVQAGWNIIGSISSPVAVASLGSSPGGIVASQFFGYSSGYHVTDTIQPGKGYWVKVYQSGKLILASTGELVPSTRIRIVPDGENPPAPPGEEVSNLKSEIPNRFALQQNYPNPFNPTTVISYQLPATSYVTLKVYNMLGQEVATLVNGLQEGGYKSVELDASSMPSGLYFYRLTAGTYTSVRKMLMIK
ncbi:MAG: T9SS type A sorting domain-containing protein [Bacteroidota bacterium]|jgi:hypothetical protein